MQMWSVDLKQRTRYNVVRQSMHIINTFVTYFPKAKRFIDDDFWLFVECFHVIVAFVFGAALEQHCVEWSQLIFSSAESTCLSFWMQ